MDGTEHHALGQRPRWVTPRRWALWSLNRAVLVYVVTVDGAVLALIGTTLTLSPVTSRHWLWFTFLAVGAVVHLEAARGIERIREIEAEGAPHTHLQSVWLFGGVLLLPPPLLAGLIAISYAHAWFRVYLRHSPLFRKAFSAATVALGCAAAYAVLGAVIHPAPGQPFATSLNSASSLGAVVAAGALYWLVNYALVVGAILATNPDQPGKKALGHTSDQLIIAASIGLATGISIVITVQPWATPVLILTVLALHMGLLLPQFRAASQIDRKTGLLNAEMWQRLAKAELARARRGEYSCGLLVIDLDHFKKVNDSSGHAAGDDVLRAVADTIRQAVRGYDPVGRLGGEEIGVLLPELSHDQVWASAERIRLLVAKRSVPTRDLRGNEITLNVTASIGAAVFPDHATDYMTMYMAADSAMFEAKRARNMTIMNPVEDLPLARQPRE